MSSPLFYQRNLLYYLQCDTITDTAYNTTTYSTYSMIQYMTYPTYDKNTYTTYNIIRWLMLLTDNYKCSFTFSAWQCRLLTDTFVILQQFQGNYDRYSVRTHAFRPALYARYVRIQPRGWRSHISMRMELYGCAWSKWMSQQFLRNQSKLTEGMKSFLNIFLFIPNVH